MAGTKEITGAAGVSANWTVQFPNLAAAGDQVVVGGYVFEYCADGSEDTPGDSAGTAADPHLITIGGTPTADTAAAALAAALIAETGTTGAWGFLHPVNATGASATTDTVTINFWPGTQANDASYITVSATGTDPTVTNVSDGAQAPTLSYAHRWNMINTTGSAQNKEYYHLTDGKVIGDTASVMVTTFAADDTPTIIGKLTDGSTASVEALFTTAEPGMYASFVWTGATWQLIEEGFGTGLTFDAAT